MAEVGEEGALGRVELDEVLPAATLLGQLAQIGQRGRDVRGAQRGVGLERGVPRPVHGLAEHDDRRTSATRRPEGAAVGVGVPGAHAGGQGLVI